MIIIKAKSLIRYLILIQTGPELQRKTSINRSKQMTCRILRVLTLALKSLDKNHPQSPSQPFFLIYRQQALFPQLSHPPTNSLIYYVTNHGGYCHIQHFINVYIKDVMENDRRKQ